MVFPKFLRVVSIPNIQEIKVNGTTSVKKEVFDDVDDIFINIIAEKLGFKYQIVSPTDGEYGTVQNGGNWTGMVGLLQRNDADLIVHRLSITEERSQVMDFSNPYHIDRIVFATRNLEHFVSRTSFLKPFSFQVWIALLICITILPVIYSILFQRKAFFGHFMQHSIFFHHLSRCNHKRIGEYIFKMSWSISEMFLRWCYIAVLLSFLTIPTLSGVRTIPELASAIREGKYQCTTNVGAFIADAMLTSQDSFLQIIGRNLKENKGSRHVENVLEDRASVKKPAFVSAENRLLPFRSKYFVSNDGFFPDLRSIGIRKGFCCKDRLDTVIDYVWASGIYSKLLRDSTYVDVIHQSVTVKDGDKKRQLTVQELDGLLIFLMAGHILSSFVLLFEVIIVKYVKK